MKILLVDDEPDILELLKYNLENDGYTVVLAADGLEALEVAQRELPDIIVLDIMMPHLDGVEVCRRMRADDNLQHKIIVMLTGRGEGYSEIAGLESGADDYIKKPVKIRVFKARIKALINRISKDLRVDNIIFGDLRVSFSERVIYRDKEAIHLPKKEFELFALLVSQQDKLFTRHEIFNHVWGSEQIISKRTIDVHVRKIREKLGDNYIQTIRNVGYKVDSNIVAA